MISTGSQKTNCYFNKIEKTDDGLFALFKNPSMFDQQQFMSGCIDTVLLITMSICFMRLLFMTTAASGGHSTHFWVITQISQTTQNIEVFSHSVYRCLLLLVPRLTQRVIGSQTFGDRCAMVHKIRGVNYIHSISCTDVVGAVGKSSTWLRRTRSLTESWSVK